MSLLADLAGGPAPRNRPCLVRTIAEGLEPADAKIFLDACDDPKWKYQTLENELNKRGVAIADITIRKHRLRYCSCEGK